MFPASYFPARYFARRYFAEHGLTPPPPALGAIRVLVNGVERQDYLWYGSTTQWNLMRGGRGTCSLPFVVPPEDTFAPQVGESIEIYDPADTRVWSGTVEATGVRWLGDDGWHVITASGVTYEQLFDTAEVDHIKYAGVTAGAAVADLYAQSGITAFGLGTIDDGPNVESLEVTNIAQGIAGLALSAGFVWYVDPLDNLLYFHAPGDRAADWELASENVLWESMDWRQSRADFRDAQVIQLPGVALQPIVATFAGDDVTTAFVLPTIPEYILTIDLSIGKTGRTVSWTPGTATVSIVAAPPTGSTVTVRYADTGVVASTAVGPAIGSKTARYTKTRSFTPAGGLQEAEAMLARYAMLPAQLTLSTDKPGIGIGRKLTIALTAPLESAALLNGEWLVQEVEGAIVLGLDQLPEPYGHFRYTVHLVNTAATAIFQGDGETEVFVLPVTPSAVTSIRPSVGAEWTPFTGFITKTPPLATGESLAVDYIDASHPPDVPTFVETWEEIAGVGGQPATVLGDATGTTAAGGEQVFKRDFTIYDTTVRDDAAPHTTVYHDGTAFRITAVLRKEILSDLTVRINKNNIELITVTVPSSTMIDEVLEWSLATGSPPILGPFYDGEVLTGDILESDGSTDEDGIVQFTLEWLLA